jgi:hypothetical protein
VSILLVDGVEVGGHQKSARPCKRVFHDRNASRQPDIVLVSQKNSVTLAQFDGSAEGKYLSTVSIVCKNLDPRIVESGHDICRAIPGAIVDNDDLVVTRELFKDTLDLAPYKLLTVIGCNAHTSHGRTGDPLEASMRSDQLNVGTSTDARMDTGSSSMRAAQTHGYPGLRTRAITNSRIGRHRGSKLVSSPRVRSGTTFGSGARRNSP